MNKKCDYKVTGTDNLEMLLRFYDEFQSEEKKKELEETIKGAGDYFEDDIDQMKVDFVLNFKQGDKNFWSDDQLVLLLSDGYSVIRGRAAGAFHYRKISARTFQEICHLQHSENEVVREACAEALCCIHSDIDDRDEEENMEYINETADVLLKLLEDKSDDVRNSAMSTFAQLRDEYSFGEDLNQKLNSFIYKAAKDTNDDMRALSALMMGEGHTDHQKDVELLNILRLDKDEDVVSCALMSLDNLVAGEDNPDVGGLSDIQSSVFSEEIEDKNISYEEMVQIALQVKKSCIQDSYSGKI